MQTLERRIDVAHGSAAARLFAQHVPRLDRLAELELHAALRHLAADRETKFKVRREPVLLERVTGIGQLVEHFGEVLGDEVRQ